MSITSAGRLELTQNAVKVLEKRYLKKDDKGNPIEKPEDLFRRVARSIAVADKNYGATEEEIKVVEDEFYSMMTALDFLPNSPTLMNAGRRLGQLSACFVLPVGDSMESIFDAVKHAAIIHKSGGGTGFSFSRLRPSGDVVGSTKGVSSGPVSFMTVFDTATEAVKQGGTRRGANMGMLRIDHPDILDFIKCKDDTKRFTNFNISIAITDEFMKAFEEDSSYSLLNPRTNEIAQTLRARDVFKLIVDHAWKTGEPGIVFIDRMNASNPTPEIGSIESTNPCGEQPLLPYESCNLGSINLACMVTVANGAPDVDWEKLSKTARLAVHFLDNVIDVNKYPIEKIDAMTKSNRKIGLGVMGWADMLVQLGVPYNTYRATRLAEEVMGFIHEESTAASVRLAERRGVFPNFEKSVFAGKTKLRNATTTTIAPTGTLSIIAGCSSGVEPLFAVSYVRTVMEGTKLVEVNPFFERIARERGFYSKELMEKIAEAGSIHDFDEIPPDVKRLFVTAHDITPVEHIRMQAAFQKHVDNAVSKTVNFPKQATPKDVEDVYMLAYNLGCKGVTVYRDGSRDEQVLTRGKQSDKKDPSGAFPLRKIAPRRRPEHVHGSTRIMKTGCGSIYVTINEDEEGEVFEIFASIGKAGGCASSQSEALGRLISLSLRSHISPEDIIKQLKGVRCHQPSWGAGGQINSCADAVAKALEQYVPHKSKFAPRKQEAAQKEHAPSSSDGGADAAKLEIAFIGACPECGGTVEHESGCAVCRNCGFTKCG